MARTNKFKISKDDFMSEFETEKEDTSDMHKTHLMENTDVVVDTHIMSNNLGTSSIDNTHDNVIAHAASDTSHTHNKAKKTVRFNMLMPEDIYEYVTKQSRYYGLSASKFINDLITKRMEEDPKKYADFK